MLELNGQPLTLEQIEAVAHQRMHAGLSAAARTRMSAARAVIEQIVDTGAVVYGVNTGFGKLSDVQVPRERLRELQLNLVRSHACGLGPPLSQAETRAMLLLRANVLAKGMSGARDVVADLLLAMLEHGLHPLIPEKGSVGASGDLAPLAHIALAMIGEGNVKLAGEVLPAAAALASRGLTPVQLEAKEGLALLNGTQAMTAIGALALARAQRLAHCADVAGAMTLEALRGTPVAFDERIHSARPHKGQTEVAAHLRMLLHNSEIRASHSHGDPRIQDAYSLRCMPQVHGAVRNALAHARETIEVETGSATDNPLVLIKSTASDKSGASSDFDVLSGGNFHGAPIALCLDYAAIALTDLASISERRIDRLVNPDLNEGLPPFLTSDPGFSSGYMIVHVSAVALLSEMKVLAHPASVDNLPTSGGKEDHVSMGVTAALKLRNALQNAELIIAIEMLAAAEGLEYRKPLRPGDGVLKAYDRVRTIAARLVQDRSLSVDIESVAAAISAGAFA